MGIPEEDRCQFPSALARQLADQLDLVAGLLERANTARADAGNNVPDYKGAYADAYHRRLATHVGDVGDTVTRFRTAASSLRAAIEQHRLDRIAENQRLATHG